MSFKGLFNKKKHIDNSCNSVQLWCQHDSSSTKSEIIVKIDINIWRISKENYLDLGIRFENWQNIKTVKIYFPFVVTNTGLIDLGKKLENQKTLRGIFNENYVQDDRTKHIIIKENDENKFFVHKIDPSNAKEVKFEENFGGTVVEITIDTKYYYEQDGYKSMPLYIRFRIKCENFGSLFKIIKPNNSFFESAFNENELIDFRLNEKRNQDENLISEIEKQSSLKISKINFFIISPVEHEIKFNGSNLTYKRQLENNNYWGAYLDTEYQSMNVYKVKVEENIEDFSAYLTFQYRKSNIGTILRYVIILGIMSIGFNLIANFIYAWGNK